MIFRQRLRPAFKETGCCGHILRTAKGFGVFETPAAGIAALLERATDVARIATQIATELLKAGQYRTERGARATVKRLRFSNVALLHTMRWYGDKRLCRPLRNHSATWPRRHGYLQRAD